MQGFEMPPRIIVTPETRSSETLEQKEAKEQQELVREWGNRLQLGFDAMVDFEQAKQITEEMTDEDDKSKSFRDIASFEARSGLNATDSFEKAKQTIESITDDSRKSQAFSALALAESQAGLDAIDSFEKAKQAIEKITLEFEKSEAFSALALAQAQSGLNATDSFEKAKQAIEKIKPNAYKSLAISNLALIEARAGLFNEARQTIENISIDNDDDLSSVFSAIAIGEANAGLFDQSKQTMQNITHKYFKSESLIALALAEFQAGLDPMESFNQAKIMAEKLDALDRVDAFSAIATAEAQAGFDTKEFFEKTKQIILAVKTDDKSFAFSTIAAAEAQVGLLDQSKQTIKQITDNYEKSKAVTALALAEAKHAEISAFHELPQDIEDILIHQNNPKTLNALGYFFPEIFEDEGRIKFLPSETQVSLKLGKVYKEQESLKESNTYDKTLADIAFTDDTKLFNRALSINLLHHDYETVSGTLLQKINNAKTDDASKIRLLKTLLEIDNPKGQSLATTLFTNQHLSPRIREYVAKKLLVEDAWDNNLIPVLAEDTKQNKKAVNETLVSMIKDLGLTPDLMSYEALNQPGILLGETLEERVNELKSLREEFSKLSLHDLREKVQDKRMRKIYYLVKGGEYRYTLINNYSFEKFALILDKINEQEVDDEVLTVFQSSLKKSGLTDDQSEAIITSLKAGKLPLRNLNTRTFSFEAAADLGSGYELALNRLQEVWGGELQTLAIASEIQDETERNKALANIDAALTMSEGESIHNEKIQKMLDLLQSQEKQDYKSMQKIAEMIRKDLLQSAKQRNDKSEVAEIGRLNTHGLFQKYLSDRLPNLKDTFALSEWESHLSETLATLETGPVQGRTKQKRFELTFLDKGKDFVRAIRFADGQQCCFNSGNYKTNGEQSSADWVARLNADPLSFIIDLKQEGSKIVSGFVFGRMGIDPDSGKPVVMLNGIYSQDKGGAIERNILKLVEDQFATMLHAESLVLASKHGGRLASAPTGYDSMQKDIQAVRALKDGEKVYDDIGSVGNGTFSFEGYGKKLV